MKKLLVLIVFVITIFQARAQESTGGEDPFWINAGVGTYGAKAKSGFSFLLDANQIHEGTLFKLAAGYHEQFKIVNPELAEKYFELGFLGGKAYSTKFFRLAFSGGLGVVTGSEAVKEETGGLLGSREEWKSKNFISPAIPIRLEASVIPLPWGAIGVGAFTNLNLKRPYWGIAAQLSFGKLR